MEELKKNATMTHEETILAAIQSGDLIETSLEKAMKYSADGKLNELHIMNTGNHKIVAVRYKKEDGPILIILKPTDRLLDKGEFKAVHETLKIWIKELENSGE